MQAWWRLDPCTPRHQLAPLSCWQRAMSEGNREGRQRGTCCSESFSSLLALEAWSSVAEKGPEPMPALASGWPGMAADAAGFSARCPPACDTGTSSEARQEGSPAPRSCRPGATPPSHLEAHSTALEQAPCACMAWHPR